MILNDKQILKKIKTNDIVISPFDIKNLGSNSYDVHLGDTLLVYDSPILDSKKENKVWKIEIPEEGYVLMPNKLYLGVTKEYTETQNLVPFLDGKSSGGRLGISIHATAGKGDIGFCGHWTLEIFVIMPVVVYKNMPIGQIFYHTTGKKTINPYNKKPNAKYMNQPNMPIPSMMYKNFK